MQKQARSSAVSCFRPCGQRRRVPARVNIRSIRTGAEPDGRNAGREPARNPRMASLVVGKSDKAGSLYSLLKAAVHTATTMPTMAPTSAGPSKVCPYLWKSFTCGHSSFCASWDNDRQTIASRRLLPFGIRLLRPKGDIHGMCTAENSVYQEIIEK